MKNLLAVAQNAGSFTTTQGYTFSGSTGGLGHQLSLVISNIVGVITVIAGLAFIFYFILGAINWITAAGDTQKASLARQQIYYALIGLVIVIIANPVTALLGKLLGVSLTNPTELIKQFL